ncbi:MAG: dihydroorotase family protein [Desulfobacterales bacterium]|nr:dihydroorotase family protein [Desulfobacterales bacterium]
MSYKYDLIIKNGTVVDPVNKRNGVMDIGISNNKVSEVAPEIDTSLAEESIDVSGKYVVPGIIDLHVHVSSWLGGGYGHKMMALAGVTTALDMSGPVDSVIANARDYGTGLNLAALQYVRAGATVKDSNPGKQELEELLQKTLEEGGYGFKILGGHYPLTPEATALAIEIAHENNAYLAFHAGTIETRSNIEGYHEAIDLIGDHPVHLAHINSYCRGRVKDCLVETEEAIRALCDNEQICSESYLAAINGTSGMCVDGVPGSQVTAMCLEKGGFPVTEKGLEDAIMSGWGQLNMESGGKMMLATGENAVAWWRKKNMDTTVSFAVNPEIPRLRLATAKRESGDFVVDCISTDGGGIPRNVTVEMGLALVKLQALSMEGFVLKTSRNPAGILGLENKGHLAEGMDADITVLDLKKQKPVMTMANGDVIMWKGQVFGKSTRFLTTPAGEKNVRENGLEVSVVDPEKTPFYRRGSFN